MHRITVTGMDRLMIEADGVSKSFGATVALDDVGLRAEGGKVLALLGPMERARRLWYGS
jgi:ABC-type sugar transport system ATPase subunit